MLIAIEIVIALIVLMCAIQGYRKGLILTVCGFLAMFVAFIGALFLANQLAQPVGAMIQPTIERSVTELMSEEFDIQLDFNHDGALVAPDASDSISLDMLQQALANSKNPLLSGLSDPLADLIEEHASTSLTDILESVIVFVSETLARIAIFIAAFFVVLLLWNIFSHAMNFAAKLPLLSTANAWGGLGVGFIKGCLVVFIATWLLRDYFITQDMIDRTTLLKFFCENSPLSLFNDFLG